MLNPQELKAMIAEYEADAAEYQDQIRRLQDGTLKVYLNHADAGAAQIELFNRAIAGINKAIEFLRRMLAERS